MGDGTEQNPYTREDVLRLIQENRDTAKGLDLSGKVFEHGIDFQEINKNDFQEIILRGAYLREANLKGANLTLANLEGADLWAANLEGANLGFANLESANLLVVNLKRAYIVNANLKGATLQEGNLESANLFESNLEGTDLRMANLNGAILVSTNLEGANLQLANLEKANLVWAQFSTNTKFDGADWGDYILGEEKTGDFNLAKEAYRQLRHWHTNAGLYDVAGEFFFREMTANRKAMKWRPNPIHRGWSKFLSLICGYGERPLRVVVWAVAVIFGLAVAYYFLGSFNTSSFWDTLYYSVVSFTAVGYGNWAPHPTGWAKGMGAAEAFFGVFMMALFLVTFTRKMTR